MKYFAMLDTEDVVEITDATTYEEAFEREPANTHWVFTEDGLRRFIESATRVLTSTEAP
jgi:hypothetical protein